MASNHPILHLHHPTPAIFAWNRLLYSHPNPISLYPRILRHGCRPDSFTFPLLLSSLRHRRPAVLRQLHGHIVVSGHSRHPHVLSSLLSAYSSLPSDLLLFLSHPLLLPDLPAANSLLSSLLRAGHLPLARHLFDQMPQRNILTWSALIHGTLNLGHPRAALSLFRSMLADFRSPAPNHFTISSVLSAAAAVTALHHGRFAHSFIPRLNLPLTPTLATSLIHMYATCGRIDTARNVFDQLPLPTRDAAVHTAIINALAVHGLASEALAAFRDMLRTPASPPPNPVTFIAVLQACVHGGLVRQGERWFAGMIRDFGVSPAIEHFGCIVDLYARAGMIDRALSTIRLMPMRPDPVIWGALLAGSRNRGDVLASEAAVGAIAEIDPGNSGAYVLISNVYAKMGRWDEVSAIRTRMERLGVKKTPGCSSVEIDGKIHEFFAGDGSVMEAESLHKMVDEIMARRRVAGGSNAGEVVVDLDGEEEGIEWRWLSDC